MTPGDITQLERFQRELRPVFETSAVGELLVAEALMGPATLVCGVGALRLGGCQASGCEDVFVDTSPNQSHRYCSEHCSSRANVAAYRARRRAEASDRARATA